MTGNGNVGKADGRIFVNFSLRLIIGLLYGAQSKDGCERVSKLRKNCGKQSQLQIIWSLSGDGIRHSAY